MLSSVHGSRKIGFRSTVAKNYSWWPHFRFYTKVATAACAGRLAAAARRTIYPRQAHLYSQVCAPQFKNLMGKCLCYVVTSRQFWGQRSCVQPGINAISPSWLLNFVVQNDLQLPLYLTFFCRNRLPIIDIRRLYRLFFLRSTAQFFTKIYMKLYKLDIFW